MRRKFFDVHAETKSPLALEALQRIAALYAVEAGIRGEAAHVRLQVRTERSAPLFVGLWTWLDATLTRVSGRSAWRKAIRYALARWGALTLVFRDGRAGIDHNAADWISERPLDQTQSLAQCRRGVFPPQVGEAGGTRQ